MKLVIDISEYDREWDSFQNLRNLIRAYEKCCEISGYVGVTDMRKGADE